MDQKPWGQGVSPYFEVTVSSPFPCSHARHGVEDPEFVPGQVSWRGGRTQASAQALWGDEISLLKSDGEAVVFWE